MSLALSRKRSAAESRFLSTTKRKRARLYRGDNVKANLCPQCTTIDLNAVFARKHGTQYGEWVKYLGFRMGWSVSTCALCDVIHKAFRMHRNDTELKWHLNSFSTSKAHTIGWDTMDTVMLGLDGIDFNRLILQSRCDSADPVRRFEDGSIDFQVLKGWIGFCQKGHTRACANKSTSKVPFLKLIDCETRDIVPAEDHPYVTLSYVWGKKKEDIIHSTRLPNDVPLTIQDSITATRGLGFRYLWVDRYCIDQKNSIEKLQQVGKMDLIYQMSEVTIVACEGEDPSYGLPGIGTRKRFYKQAYGKVGKHFLISTMGDPQSAIKSSKWITRAWTRQEGLLSRRRLFFTCHQVYYECHGMYCFETLNFPLKELHTKDGQGFKGKYRTNELVGIFPKGVGRQAWEVVARICEYSQKARFGLTHQSDALNGILGILRAFETSKFKLHHISGVPVLPRLADNKRGIGSRVSFCDTSTASQSWSLTAGLLFGLCFTTSGIGRRPGFPSWSWTGWQGSSSWTGGNSFLGGALEQQALDAWNWKWRFPTAFQDTKVGIELVDGRVVDLDTLKQNKEPMPEQSAISKFLHIEAWTTTVLKFHLTTGGMIATFPLEDGGSYTCLIHLDTPHTLPNELTAIHILQPKEVFTMAHAAEAYVPKLLIVGKIDGKMERVGLDDLNGFDLEILDKDGNSLWSDELPDDPLFGPGHRHPNGRVCPVLRAKLAKTRSLIRLG
jgi:hypothetical protein